jgi:hypothetical protein
MPWVKKQDLNGIIWGGCLTIRLPIHHDAVFPLGLRGIELSVCVSDEVLNRNGVLGKSCQASSLNDHLSCRMIGGRSLGHLQAKYVLR